MATLGSQSNSLKFEGKSGGFGQSRTADLWVMNPSLSPTELQSRVFILLQYKEVG